MTFVRNIFSEGLSPKCFRSMFLDIGPFADFPALHARFEECLVEVQRAHKDNFLPGASRGRETRREHPSATASPSTANSNSNSSKNFEL